MKLKSPSVHFYAILCFTGKNSCNESISMTLNIKYQNELTSIIKKHLPHCVIYLFGSRATGACTQGSDIDIALDDGHLINHKTLLKILIDIEDTTIPMKVDLVDLQTAPDTLKNSIIKEGIIWKN